MSYESVDLHLANGEVIGATLANEVINKITEGAVEIKTRNRTRYIPLENITMIEVY